MPSPDPLSIAPSIATGRALAVRRAARPGGRAFRHPLAQLLPVGAGGQTGR